MIERAFIDFPRLTGGAVFIEANAIDAIATNGTDDECLITIRSGATYHIALSRSAVMDMLVDAAQR